MKPFTCLISMIALSCLVFFANVAISDDLNDGISKYTEEGIGKDDEVFEKDINIKYLKMKAAGKSSAAKQKAEAEEQEKFAEMYKKEKEKELAQLQKSQQSASTPSTNTNPATSLKQANEQINNTVSTANKMRPQ